MSMLKVLKLSKIGGVVTSPDARAISVETSQVNYAVIRMEIPLQTRVIIFNPRVHLTEC
jgi:hypothetical protein